MENFDLSLVSTCHCAVFDEDDIRQEQALDRICGRYRRSWYLIYCALMRKFTHFRLYGKKQRPARPAFYPYRELGGRVMARQDMITPEESKRCRLVRYAVDTLPPIQAQIIKRFYFDEIDAASIANERHITVSGVENCLSRARRNLAQKLRSVLGDSDE